MHSSTDKNALFIRECDNLIITYFHYAEVRLLLKLFGNSKQINLLCFKTFANTFELAEQFVFPMDD